MKVLVQKFGGTSVASIALRDEVVSHVVRAKNEGYHPVVVVSAMGRNGAPYATDTLIGLARDAGGPVGGRELDLLMSCGEIIAAVIMAQTLIAKGHPALALTGAQAGIITNNHFGEARVLRVNAEKIQEELTQGKVPVITGFQGVTASGDITTLGRGGSDTSAAVLGVALNAELVEIYTDVDGVKTADPRLVPDAVTLDQMTYAEVVEMALLGAKVIHPRAVEIAREGRIPLKVRSITGDGPGTLISAGSAVGQASDLKGDRTVVGVAHVTGRAHICVDASDMPPTQISGIFEGLADAGISVDMIGVSLDQVRVTIQESLAERAREVLAQLGFQATVTNGYAKVSVVGAGMHGVPGVMARVAGALAKAGVMIYQTTDSHANISCLVREDDVVDALAALHYEFGLHQKVNHS